MNETDDEKCSLNKKEQLLIEGYKALNQYGCQMSQDHLSVDRIFMPLSLAPAIWVLRPLNGPIDDNWAKSFILLGGRLLIGFWMLRNWRSGKRLSAIWDILRLIKEQLGFKAYRTLKTFMGDPDLYNGRFRRWTFRDFTLKTCFGGLHLCSMVVFWYMSGGRT